ncbi:MAG: acylphosphatase [Verrucomicrobiales bacterium]|jgi:acylphosphatase
MSTKQILYYGEVQAVGFRYAIAHEAMHYDVKGEVQNCSDGAIRVKVTGDDDEVDDFLKAVREGRFSDNIEEEEIEDIEPLHGMAGFKVH